MKKLLFLLSTIHLFLLLLRPILFVIRNFPCRGFIGVSDSLRNNQVTFARHLRDTYETITGR